jgi:hypothetical protein
VTQGLGDGPTLNLVGGGKPDTTSVLVLLTVSNSSVSVVALVIDHR